MKSRTGLTFRNSSRSVCLALILVSFWVPLASAQDSPIELARAGEAFEHARALSEADDGRFLEGPVLILPLGETLRYTFNPQGAEALGELGTVYLTSRVTDEWGVLQVTNGILLSRDPGGRVSEARVPAPGTPVGPTLEGDGWTLTLAEDWKLVPSARMGDFTLVKER